MLLRRIRLILHLWPGLAVLAAAAAAAAGAAAGAALIAATDVCFRLEHLPCLI